MSAICPCADTFFSGCKQSVVCLNFNIFGVEGRLPRPCKARLLSFCRNLACKLPPASLLFHGEGASRGRCQSVVSEELAASGHHYESSGSLSSNVRIPVHTTRDLEPWFRHLCRVECFHALRHFVTGSKNLLIIYWIFRTYHKNVVIG